MIGAQVHKNNHVGSLAWILVEEWFPSKTMEKCQNYVLHVYCGIGPKIFSCVWEISLSSPPVQVGDQIAMLMTLWLSCSLWGWQVCRMHGGEGLWSWDWPLMGARGQRSEPSSRSVRNDAIDWKPTSSRRCVAISFFLLFYPFQQVPLHWHGFIMRNYPPLKLVLLELT